MRQNYPLTLLYDAACPVCALEMDHLRSRDGAGGLVFVDISQPNFDATVYGATFEQLDAEIHGVRPDGSLIRGMEVLRLAYGAAGLGWVLHPTGVGLLRPLFDMAYRLFARYRRPISLAMAPVIDAVRAHRARQLAARMGRCSRARCDAATFANGRGEEVS